MDEENTAPEKLCADPTLELPATMPPPSRLSVGPQPSCFASLDPKKQPPGATFRISAFEIDPLTKFRKPFLCLYAASA